LTIYIVFKDTLLFSRINSADKIVNNNRTNQIPNVLNFLTPKTFFWGLATEILKNEKSNVNKYVKSFAANVVVNEHKKIWKAQCVR
jgi:hypothetical protein